MKSIAIAVCGFTFLFLGSCSNNITQSPAGSFDLGPYLSDAATVGMWHFDESSGSILADSSSYHNDGAAFATAVVSGRYGYGQGFDGISSYITIPSHASLDLDTSSFTIDLWFKTTTEAGAFLLRRGLAPVPGYTIAINGGRLQGMIGNRGDSSWPDTLISIWSDSTYNDDRWHCVSLVRNRSTLKLLLYVDGRLAAKPVDDMFTIPLNNGRPLTIGRWEHYAYPDFFVGSVDELRIKRGVQH